MSKQTLSWQEQLLQLSDKMPAGEAQGCQTDDNVVRVKTSAEKCGKISIFFEKKGRGGKQATIIAGLDNLSEEELQKLASEIKKKLATGGSARAGEILIQGDRRREVADFLKSKGFKGCNI